MNTSYRPEIGPKTKFHADKLNFHLNLTNAFQLLRCCKFVVYFDYHVYVFNKINCYLRLALLVVIFKTFENQFLEAFFSTTWKIGKQSIILQNEYI